MTTEAIRSLRDTIRAEVITPHDDAYDEVRRVYNGMIDRRPSAIVRPTSTEDVANAVRFAQTEGLELAIRGGGHSVAGFGTLDDGLVIDLSAMRTVLVDAGSRTAKAQGGALWADFNDATYEHGLATTGGIISTTGVAGLTLGGGIGFLTRGHGLSCDNLISAEIVTAEGRAMRASDQENQDLFWAIRGGGGNFGVATQLEFRLHPVRDIYGGPIFYEAEDAAAIFELYREFIVDAPELFGGFPAWQIAPPLPFIPEERHGDTLVAFVSCWSGSPGDGEGVLKPFRDVAPIVAEHVDVMPYPAINSAFDALMPPGLQQYWKTTFSAGLSDSAIEAHLEHGPKVPAASSTMHIYPISGATHRVAPDATAFAHRDRNFATVVAGAWPDATDNQANMRWVSDYHAALAPHSEPGGYVNFMSDDDQGNVEISYRANYNRLVDIKRKYDPDNLFHHNQNIAP